MMTLISLKRLFVAPVFDETFSSTQLLSLANLRSWCLLAFVVLDFFIYGMLTGSDSIRQDALLFFALVNIGMLSLDLALNQFWIARRRHCWMGLLGFSVVIESFTVIVWIQLTGSLSSYFLFVPYLLICAYRIVGNYRLSLLCTVSSVVFFSLGFLFEELELLRRGGLFEVPLGGFYTISSFRRVVFFSVLMTYPAVFMMVNLHILRIREKDEALAKAKKKLAKKDAKKGDPDEDEEEQVEDPPDKFVIDLHGASQEFLHVWLPRDEKNNFTQEHDEELLKDELRDGVREKIRLEVCPPARRVLRERADTEALFRRWTYNWRLS